MSLKMLFGKMSVSMKGEGSPSVEESWDLYRAEEGERRERREKQAEAREMEKQADGQEREESHDSDDDYDYDEEEETEAPPPRSLEELMVELKDVFMLIEVGWQQKILMLDQSGIHQLPEKKSYSLAQQAPLLHPLLHLLHLLLPPCFFDAGHGPSEWSAGCFSCPGSG